MSDSLTKKRRGMGEELKFTVEPEHVRRCDGCRRWWVEWAYRVRCPYCRVDNES